MEESGFVCGMSEEGEDWKWDNKPLRGWVFSNNSEEIDCQCGSLLSLFWFMSSFGTKFTFTYYDVKVNSSQLNDACDQGLTVETCCARKNKI